MMGRLRTGTGTAGGQLARPGARWRLAAVPAAALTLTLGFAVPAMARTHAGTDGRARASSSVVLRTLVSHVNVRTAASRHAHIVGTIGKSGTAVTVSCYAMGSAVAGNAVWYRISAPESGYITSYYTATHVDPASGVSRCPAFSRPYHTVVKGLHIRTKPTTAAPIYAVLGAIGAKVTVSCYTYGQNVQGDSVWYHTLMPRAGYVAGLNLDTGADPAPGVPACG